MNWSTNGQISLDMKEEECISLPVLTFCSSTESVIAYKIILLNILNIIFIRDKADEITVGKRSIKAEIFSHPIITLR